MRDLASTLREYQGARIAIYGLGAQAEALLQQLEGAFQIVCLLDGYRESGTLYGKPILPLESAVQRGIRLIVVAARPSSCRIIAKRIGGICAENEILLLDAGGNDLQRAQQEGFDGKEDDVISRAQLMELTGQYDVVSIDLFDTLVMRRVLFQTDVFDLVEQRLRQKGVLIEDFAGKRLESEKRLSQHSVPVLTEIYDDLTAVYGVSGISAEELAKLEWAVDEELMVPREELCALIRDIYRKGKPVYIVSDTYYTSVQAAHLLERCHIPYTDLIVSCEHRTCKTQKLFSVLCQRIPGKSCLHLGDDPAADGENAARYGMTPCRIYSGIDLFARAGYMGLWDLIGDLPSRVRIGMFVACFFNSPFRPEHPAQRRGVDSAYDIGFLFFAPLISDFVLWLDRQIRERGLHTVWFSARDGYLPKLLYDQLADTAESIYFLTSRTAAVRAGMEDEEDIRAMTGVPFSGDLRTQMQKRFGISEEEGGPADFADAVLRRAAAARNGYQAYLSSLHTREGEIAFFDFVARGTVQRYMERLTGNHLTGFYFLWLSEGQGAPDTLDVASYYNLEDAAGKAMFEEYSIVESILTSPSPMVESFSESGKPCYAAESRTEKDLCCIRSVQRGIAAYFETYLRLCPPGQDSAGRELSVKLLSLIHQIPIVEHDFLSLPVDDPFHNRTASVSDLL